MSKVARTVSSVSAQERNGCCKYQKPSSPVLLAFVCCLSKMPDQFDQAVVLNQLRYSGMLETVRIRKAGYAVRRPFQDFYKRQDGAE
ncbi:Myosin-X [Myotis davidii]|uniref:Myosin-X n=1 Tax=Myotis davidii TaxID=225400 RepID=L5LJR0_MYODS|nr:Myosin-X [Myotis davidii]